MDTQDPTLLAHRTPGVGLKDHETQIDMVKLRAYRLGRLQEQLAQRDVGASVLFDPINIRYATGSRNMQVWCLHNAARYAFVPAEGKVVLFEFHGCDHLSEGLETIDEVRPATSWFFFTAGDRLEQRARRWAEEIADLMAERCGGNRRLALDHVDPAGARALEALGVDVLGAQEPCERARAIKSAEEIACMNVAIAVCEAGMARMREALRPGMTENQLWALLHETNIAHGGEWIETRLLSSGERTNPWFQEASDRMIRAGDLVAFDTDLIGPFGYCADISRTYHCGPGRPTPEQRRLYSLAFEQVQYNMELLRPGVSFREVTEKAWRMPNVFVKNRYPALVHGVGLCDEYPAIPYAEDMERYGYEGVIEENMTLCVESYIGEEDGREGVKLEEQVLVTPKGVRRLSTFPFEDSLLG